MLLLAGMLVAAWVLFFGSYLTGGPYPNAEKAKEIQPFITGLVAPLLTLGSTLLVLENLRISTRQNFSTNFLKLLDFHHKLVDGITTTVAGISGEGLTCKSSDKRAFFDDLASRIASDYEAGYIYDKGAGDPLPETDPEKLKNLYAYYYNFHHSDVGHYIRHFYNLLLYIEAEGLSKVTRQTMVRLLKTQLSNYELLLLAYHGIAIDTSLALKLEQYEILEWLNLETGIEEDVEKRMIADTGRLKKTYPHIAGNK